MKKGLSQNFNFLGLTDSQDLILSYGEEKNVEHHLEGVDIVKKPFVNK